MSYVKPLIGKGRDVLPLATHRMNIWEGSVRSSKTVGSLMAWIAYTISRPSGNLLMIGKTERTLKRNILDVIVDWLGPQRARIVTGSGELHLCGRRIYLAGANDEKAQQKIRGLTLAGVYIDEISLIPESMMTMVLSRLSEPGARLYGTTNPDSPNHWLLRDYLSRPTVHVTGDGKVLHASGDNTLDLARFSFRLDDNPYLDPEYVKNLKREYVGLWYKRFIDGLWVVADGAVYEAWDPDRHVIPATELPHITRWIGAGVDYGTTNPFDALILGLGDDRRLYLTHEWRWDSRQQRRQLTDVEYSERYRRFLAEAKAPGTQQAGIGPEIHAIDPSAASFRLQLYRDGIITYPADNEVLDGIRLVSSLIAGDQLRVADTCAGWIEEAPGYVWDPKASAKGLDEPMKIADHALDAGRYVCRSTRHIWQSQIRPAADRYTRAA